MIRIWQRDPVCGSIDVHDIPIFPEQSFVLGDYVQLIHLALDMADDGLPAVQLIVGERDLQVLQGAVT
jgi:hypothetical protein